MEKSLKLHKISRKNKKNNPLSKGDNPMKIKDFW